MTPASPVASSPGEAFVRWIPGDALTAYTALLATIGATSGPRPGPGLVFVIGAALVIVLAVAGAGPIRTSGMRSRTPFRRTLAVRTSLALVAFFLYATLLPTSWPSTLFFVEFLGSAYAPVLAIAAVIFTWVAQRLAPS